MTTPVKRRRIGQESPRDFSTVPFEFVQTWLLVGDSDVDQETKIMKILRVSKEAFCYT